MYGQSERTVVIICQKLLVLLIQVILVLYSGVMEGDLNPWPPVQGPYTGMVVKTSKVYQILAEVVLLYLNQ